MKRMIFITALFLVGALHSHAQRRVITNEDLAPVVPPQTEAAAAATTADDSAPSAKAGLPKTPATELARLKEIQMSLQSIYQELNARAVDAQPVELVLLWRKALEGISVASQTTETIIAHLETGAPLPPAQAGTDEGSQSESAAPASE